MAGYLADPNLGAVRLLDRCAHTMIHRAQLQRLCSFCLAMDPRRWHEKAEQVWQVCEIHHGIMACSKPYWHVFLPFLAYDIAVLVSVSDLFGFDPGQCMWEHLRHFVNWWHFEVWHQCYCCYLVVAACVGHESVTSSHGNMTWVLRLQPAVHAMQAVGTPPAKADVALALKAAPTARGSKYLTSIEERTDGPTSTVRWGHPRSNVSDIVPFSIEKSILKHWNILCFEII